MERKRITIESNQLEYVVFNKDASDTLLCFHGFGQEGSDFKQLAIANPKYKIVAFDLFFHKNSYLQPIKLLEKSSWKNFLDKVIESESINRFSLVGFSLGGRFALTTLQLVPDNVESVYLIAPDGLVEGGWFRFATGSTIQRIIFRWALNSYSVFKWFSSVLSKLGLLNKGLLKFTQIHLKNEEDRDRVFKTWICFRNLKLSTKELHHIIQSHRIKTVIIMGIYDRVIPIKRIKPKLLKSANLKLLEIPITHNKLFYYNFLDAT